MTANNNSWLRASNPLLWACFSFVAFWLASQHFNRQIAAWSYARHPQAYSLANFRILYVREVTKNKRVHKYVGGTITNREVETIYERTGLPPSVFQKLKEGELREYTTSVLYAPQFDDQTPKSHGLSSVHVVEADIQGSTPMQVALNVAIWNIAWLTGAAVFVICLIRESNAYRRNRVG